MDYIARHIGPDQHEQQELLRVLGYDSIDALIAAAVPSGILADGPLELPEALTEYEAQARLRELAGKNRVLRAFYGQGFNSTLTPPVIRRGVVEDAGWYTAYTPYQAEISQGRMEALINFQTMLSDLTGMDIANASLLDEGTAAAEAMTLAKRSAKSKSNVFFVSTGVHPQTLEVLRTARATRASATGAELWQLQIIISDGVCQDHERLRAQIRRAMAERVMLVFVVVDAADDDEKPPRSSILTMNQVSYHTDAAGKLQLQMQRYIDTFPFDSYVIVRDVQALPGVLASTLRQWAEKIRDA